MDIYPKSNTFTPFKFEVELKIALFRDLVEYDIMILMHIYPTKRLKKNEKNTRSNLKKRELNVTDIYADIGWRKIYFCSC